MQRQFCCGGDLKEMTKILSFSKNQIWADASLYPETGEDPALTLAQRSTPVHRVHGLNVENRPPEQLHHVSPQLHAIIKARAVVGYHALRYKRQTLTAACVYK